MFMPPESNYHLWHTMICYRFQSLVATSEHGIGPSPVRLQSLITTSGSDQLRGPNQTNPTLSPESDYHFWDRPDMNKSHSPSFSQTSDTTN